MPGQQIWSDNLGWIILSSLPAGELAKQWAAISAGAGSSPSASRDLRDWLASAREDDDVRRWIVTAWRETHPDVVSAVDQALIEALRDSALQVLESFPLEDVLIAFLTDEVDDGRELTKAFLDRVKGSRRCAFLNVLRRLLGDQGEAGRPRVRVVILGGHQRDESKLGQRLFENSPFDVRWKTFEKKPSSGIVQKAVAGVLGQADATLIITGMASHMLMQFAKDYAKSNGILWKCIEKATENQLKAALREVFPQLTDDWM